MTNTELVWPIFFEVWPNGEAPDFGSGDCRFESCHGRILLLFYTRQTNTHSGKHILDSRSYFLETYLIVNLFEKTFSGPADNEDV